MPDFGKDASLLPPPGLLPGEGRAEPDADADPDYWPAAAGKSLGEQPHDPEHCHHGGQPHLGPCIDGGKPDGG